jgi:mono/diheme cytochrome c family protein
MTRMGAAILTLTALAAAGCHRPLPEQNTAAARLYARRCGQCHTAYAPGSLTAAMWQVQIDVMETKMRQYSVAPLTGQERDAILSYLTRNAAHD